MHACMHACMHAQAQQSQAFAALKQATSNNEPLAQVPHASSIRGTNKSRMRLAYAAQAPHASSIRSTSPVNWTLLERATAAAKGESFFFFSIHKKKRQ